MNVPVPKKMRGMVDVDSSTVFKKPKQDASDVGLEVTGVSRCGRVRKKSSLLADFESPDELDTRYKRKAERIREKELKAAEEDSGGDSDNEPGDGYQGNQLDDDEEESMDAIGLDEMDVDDDSDIEDEEEGLLVVDTGEEGGKKKKLTSQAQSVYFMEKSSKKNLIIRDGKVVGRAKAIRKDKGKTRFTAYMLWAREVRKEIMRQRPELDFVAMSKRLGELWATVPNSEKYNWKRRARRLATKGVSLQDTTRRWKASAVTSTSSGLLPSLTEPIIPRPLVMKSNTIPVATLPLTCITPSRSIPKAPPPSKGGPLVSDPVVGPGMYKVVGTEPIDVAAHLKLLGESLSIIGQRLKEHEGQIAVSGSLSVLLDSLVCSLGPLICLTQCVPETNGCNMDTLSSILDNIAYIMPGL